MLFDTPMIIFTPLFKIVLTDTQFISAGNVIVLILSVAPTLRILRFLPYPPIINLFPS